MTESAMGQDPLRAGSPLRTPRAAAVGSGLLFVGMLFVAAAVAGALVAGVTALVLLAGIGVTPWVELLFPLWILALSLDILLAGRRTSPAQRLAEPSNPRRDARKRIRRSRTPEDLTQSG